MAVLIASLERAAKVRMASIGVSQPRAASLLPLLPVRRHWHHQSHHYTAGVAASAPNLLWVQDWWYPAGRRAECYSGNGWAGASPGSSVGQAAHQVAAPHSDTRGVRNALPTALTNQLAHSFLSPNAPGVNRSCETPGKGAL